MASNTEYTRGAIKKELSMIWFTADSHFGHTNIIKPEYCNRPYNNVDEMNEAIVNNWNTVVDITDTVYHLGDFGFDKYVNLNAIAYRLNGAFKYLILGNHDKKIRNKRSLGDFIILGDYYELKICDEEMGIDQIIILSHYALSVWNHAYHGSWMLHGHSHGTVKSTDQQARLDVGVDVHNFMPISYEQVKAIMTRKVFKCNEQDKACGAKS